MTTNATKPPTAAQLSAMNFYNRGIDADERLKSVEEIANTSSLLFQTSLCKSF
jgi:hypothetical protein